MKRKKLLTLAGSVCLILVLASLPFMTACPAPPEEEAPPPAEEEAPPPAEEEAPPPPFQWPKVMTLVSFSITSADYLTAVAWGTELEKSTGMKFRAITESTTPVRIRWLRTGEVDFTADSLPTYADICEAVAAYPTRDLGPFDVRLVWGGPITAFGIAVPMDSPIKTMDDIKPGDRYALWATSPTFVAIYKAHLNMLEMTEDELVAVSLGSYAGSVKAIAEGKADMCVVAPTASVAYELAASPTGICWLNYPEMGTAASERFLQVAPSTLFGKPDLGVEIARDVRMMVHPKAIWTRAETDPDFIYNLGKWLDENYDLYKGKYDSAALLDISHIERLLSTTFIPIHEGAIRYFKELGLWTAAHDARQEYNLNLVRQYIEVYRDAIALADADNISVTPENEEWVELWENYKKELGIPRFKAMTDDEIREALGK